MTPRQAEILAAYERLGSVRGVGKELGVTPKTVRTALKRAAIDPPPRIDLLDPQIKARLEEKGYLPDIKGLHSGWIIDKDKHGAGESLYFYIGKDEQKRQDDFLARMRDEFSQIVSLPPLERVPSPKNGLANFIFLADLHVGGEYGTPELEARFNDCADRLVTSLPDAEKAFILELGDLLDANDHKGVTPASGNHCEVIPPNGLQNALCAVRMLKRIIYRALERHSEVEVHLIRGNHDETAFHGVLIGLSEHFRDNPQVNIVLDGNEFRVVRWGACGVFPNHGDKAKWEQLKDVWAEMYADEWAACKAWRLIATAHFHHDKQKDLVGASARHFRTLASPNKWARSLGLLNRGTLTAITLHKEEGYDSEYQRHVKLRYEAAA